MPSKPAQHVPGDDDLMAAAAAGDALAFSVLTQRHRGWVHAVMCAYVHDPDQAEDLTQDAFCRVYLHRDRYSAQGTFVAWLKRIAVNVAKNHLRRQRQAAFLSLEEIEELPAAEFGPDPLAVLSAGFLKDDLKAAIEALPEAQRLVMAMYYFGDMNVQDIAWAMKCPIGTVRSRLFNGLKRVRQFMTARWEGEEGDFKS